MVNARWQISAMLVGIAFLTTGCFDGGSSGATSASASTSTSTSSGAATSSLSVQGSPASAVAVGSTYYFQPVAQGAAGSTLSYTISGKPAWASFSTSSGQLTGSPQANQVGSYGNITITASNGAASSTIGPFSISVVTANSASNTGSGSGSATLVWSVPTVNTDGSTLMDLAGYKIYYGNSEADLSQVVNIANATVTSFVIDKLGSGTYFFAISAYNRAGAESAMKLVGSKQIS